EIGHHDRVAPHPDVGVDVVWCDVAQLHGILLDAGGMVTCSADIARTGPSSVGGFGDGGVHGFLVGTQDHRYRTPCLSVADGHRPVGASGRVVGCSGDGSCSRLAAGDGRGIPWCEGAPWDPWTGGGTGGGGRPAVATSRAGDGLVVGPQVAPRRTGHAVAAD